MNQYEIRNLEGASAERLLVVILSPAEMNQSLGSVIVAPLTRESHGYPTRPWVRVHGEDWWVVLDQMTTISKNRVLKKQAKLDEAEVRQVKSIILEMLVS